MMKAIRSFYMIAAILAALSFPAQGQVMRLIPHPCLPEKRMSETLKQIGERPTGVSANKDGSRFEFWKGSESWTLVHTDKRGESCIAGAGKTWRGHIPGLDA